MAGTAYPIFCSGSIATGAGTTSYWVVGDSDIAGYATATAAGSVTYRQAGTLSGMCIVCQINPAISGAITFTSSIAGSTGNQSISIASGVTGVIVEGTPHTDSISSGNTIGIAATGTLSGNATFQNLGLVFTPTSGTNKRIAAGNNDVSSSTANNTSYYSAFGQLIKTSTELNTGTELFVTGTLQNAAVVTSLCNRVNSTTIRSRVGTGSGQANGNILVSVPATPSGIGTFSDLSNTDTLANTGTVINWSLTTGTGTQSITVNSINAEIATSDSTSVVAASYVSSTNSGGTTQRYTPFAGGMEGFTTSENLTQVNALATYNVSNLCANCTANATPVTCSVRMRKNTAFGNGIASVTSTGYFSDVSNTDSYGPTDLINIGLKNGTSGTVTFVSFSAKLSQAVTFNPDEDFWTWPIPALIEPSISIWQ